MLFIVTRQRYTMSKKSEPKSKPLPEPLPESSYHVLKSGIAKKAGMRSEGEIGYQLLINDGTLYVRLVSNNRGGYFSRECIPFSRIADCLSATSADRAIPSKAFRTAFVGKSANNAGFLAAVLREEGVIAAAPENVHLHLVCDDWPAWHQALLARDADKDYEEVNVDAISQQEIPSNTERTSVSRRKKATGQHEHPAHVGNDEQA